MIPGCTDSAARKQAARLRFRAIRSKLNRAGRADAACARLKSSRIWTETDHLLLYLSAGTELDTEPVFQAALSEGKAVYAPRICGPDISFHRLYSLEETVPGPYRGLREPLPSAPLWSPRLAAKGALVLAPGLAFSTRGARLGQGGGYYDRFIRTLREDPNSGHLFIGYGYREQISSCIPGDPHDQRLDGVVTDSDFFLIHDPVSKLV